MKKLLSLLLTAVLLLTAASAALCEEVPFEATIE